MDFYYRGTHGTTCSAADLIERNGFSAGAGLRGFGVYFWLYQFDGLLDEAHKLAVAWYNNENKRGSYSEHKDKKCAVIKANLSTEEKDIFDFESKRQMFMLYSQAIKERLEDEKLGKDERKELISGIHDKFFHDWETEEQKEYSAVLVRVQSPKGFVSGFDRDVASQPQCILVRNKDIIDIVDITKLDS